MRPGAGERQSTPGRPDQGSGRLFDLALDPAVLAGHREQRADDRGDQGARRGEGGGVADRPGEAVGLERAGQQAQDEAEDRSGRRAGGGEVGGSGHDGDETGRALPRYAMRALRTTAWSPHVLTTVSIAESSWPGRTMKRAGSRWIR